MYQISEDDLASLEHDLPQLIQALEPMLTNRNRVQVRRVQRIMRDVRWNYGPPDQVTVIPADGDQIS